MTAIKLKTTVLARYALDDCKTQKENSDFLHEMSIKHGCYAFGYYRGPKGTKNIRLFNCVGLKRKRFDEQFEKMAKLCDEGSLNFVPVTFTAEDPK